MLSRYDRDPDGPEEGETMPTNRRKLLRGRIVYTLRVEDLDIMERICLMTGWHPGMTAAVRWKTWSQFFRDSDAVRDELLADEDIQRIYPGVEPFADVVRRDLADSPGAVYDSHGGWQGHSWPAIRHAHVFTPGDDHRHEDYGGYARAGVPPAGELVTA
jgi:hypothetical protein